MIFKIKKLKRNKTENCYIFPKHPLLYFIKKVFRLSIRDRKLFAKCLGEVCIQNRADCKHVN